MINMAKEYMKNGMSELDAITLASDVVISKQVTRTSMPRRFSQMARDIWQLQIRLKRTKGSRPIRLIQHPKFRAGYDFLLLRAATDGSDSQLAEWWTDFIEKQGQGQSQAVTQPRNKRRHRNRHRPPKSGNT
jgi:poly(A) polymerase